MTESLRHQSFIVAIAAVVFLVNLGGPRLFDEDEPKNAACGQEMFQRGEWIVPFFNAELRTDKPILLYWLMLASYHTLGVSEFSARLPSALMAIGTTLLVYHLGRQLFSASVGIWAAAILATSLMFDVVARAATPDSTFIFFTTLTLLVFVIATARISHGPWGNVSTASDAPRSQRIAALVDWPYRYWVAFYAAMGLATLAKGPAGIVLPGGVVGLYLLVASARGHGKGDLSSPTTWIGRGRSLLSRTAHVFSPPAIVSGVWQMRPLTAIAVVGLIALPWYVAVGVQTSGDWLVGFFGHHNVGRFTQPLEGHSGPVFYYAIAIAIGFFPWSIFLAPMILHAVNRFREQEHRPAMTWVCCWIVMYLGFFSLAQTKLPNYVLPAYPALALLAAAFVQHWIGHPESVGRWLRRASLSWVPVVGLVLALAFPVVAHYLLPGEGVLAVVGITLLVGGVITVWLAENQRIRQSARCLAGTAVAFTVIFFGFGADRVSRHMTSQPFAETVAVIDDAPTQLATFGFFEPSIVFYHSAPVVRCHSTDDVDALLSKPERAFVAAPADRLQEMQAFVRGDLVEIARRRRFLRRGDVVLLGPPAAASRTNFITSIP